MNDDQTRPDRRDVLKKAAIGGAIAWTAPVISTFATPAQAATVLPPTLVLGSPTSAYMENQANVFPYVRTITITTGSPANPLQVGDVVFALIAFDTRTAVNAPGAGWTTYGPLAQVGGNANYSVQAWLFQRTLVAGDIVNGAYTKAFSTPSVGITQGGLRGAMVAYRNVGTQAGAITVTTGQGSGPTSGSNVVTSTFPANVAATTPNVILRFGAARGYGGCNGLDNDIDWQSWPGAGLVDASGGNEGDRALVVSEEIDGAGSAANGTWYRQSTAILCTPQANWATFTVKLLPQP